MQREEEDPSDLNVWEQVFCPSHFFQRFQHFLRVDVSAKTSDDFARWFGWVESRMRHLPPLLEGIGPLYAHPYADSFSTSDNECSACFLIGIEIQSAFTSDLELTKATQQFATRVSDWPNLQTGMDLSIVYVAHENLPKFVLDSGYV